jgi:hypothetical protein
VSGGYGRHRQFVPRGTESPNATTDHVLGAPYAVVEDAIATQLSAIRAATTESRRSPISRMYRVLTAPGVDRPTRRLSAIQRLIVRLADDAPTTEPSCPCCGSTRIVVELRDPAEMAPETPREAYGRWLVCEACEREWPDDEGGS